MLWSILLLLAALGVVLLIAGAKGRRVDDHPVCRKCSFDLAGVYPGASRCPECGGDVGGPGTIRRGNRKRRPGAAVVGALLVMIAAAGAGIAAWSTATAFNWNTVKPAWLLMRELHGGGWVEAREELLQRESRGGLPPGLRRALLDHVLHVHGDAQAEWDNVWAGFLEDQWAEGNLTNTQLVRYARQAIRTSATMYREQARQGSVAGAVVDIEAWRVVRGANMLFVRASHGRTWLDGEPVGEPSRTMGTLQVSRTMRYGLVHQIPIPETLEGRHPVRVAGHLSLHLDDAEATPLVEWTVEHELEVEIVPAEMQLVEFVTDPEIDSAVRSAVRLISAAIQYRHGRMASMTHVRVDLEIRGLPIALRHEVVAVYAGRSTRLGMLTRSADPGGELPWTQPLLGDLRGFEGDTIDIIIRPDVAMAEMSGAARVWGGEIIFRDVPLASSAETGSR
jgi:hypothetical protein